MGGSRWCGERACFLGTAATYVKEAVLQAAGVSLPCLVPITGTRQRVEAGLFNFVSPGRVLLMWLRQWGLGAGRAPNVVQSRCWRESWYLFL